MSDDHGASAERTRLAWRRTWLSATAVALLAARPAFDPATGPAHVLLAAAAAVAWAMLTTVAYRRTRRLARRTPAPGHRAITAYAASTVVLALIGGLVVTF